MTGSRSATVPAPVTYNVGHSGSAGVWLGLGMTRIAVLGVGLLAGILTLTAGLSVVLALIPLLLAASVASLRIAGRPLLDWTVPFGAHHGAAATGTVRWRSSIPTMSANGGAIDAPVRLRLPNEFGRLQLGPCPDDPLIGTLLDAPNRSITVVFDVCGTDRFPLLDAAEQDTLIAGWGDALAVLADTDDTLDRLQMIERAYPIDSRLDDPYPGDDQGWNREIAALATGHDSRLAVQWSFPRLDATAVATIASRCHLLSRTLLSARLITRPLSARDLAAELLTTLTGPPSAGSSAPSDVGPVSRRTDWTQVAIDDRLHRSFAVTGWPTSAVGAEWLSPLLVSASASATRTVSLHLERVAPAAAARVARTRRAKAILDQTDRARLGMTSSAALQVAEASGIAMDAELAAGYRTHRLAGLITLSADSVEGLDEAVRGLRQAAALCRLELRPLHGQHDVALAATAPLCRLRPRGLT
jgi:hypothetical protein